MAGTRGAREGDVTPQNGAFVAGKGQGATAGLSQGWIQLEHKGLMGRSTPWTAQMALLGVRLTAGKPPAPSRQD